MASSIRRPITFGERTFDVSPLDSDSQNALDAWVQERYIEKASAFIGSLKPELRAQAMSIAMDKAMTLTWMSEVGAELMATVDGVARVLYEGIRKNHPDVTYEDVKKLMMSPDNIEKANRVFKSNNIRRVDQGGDPKKSLSKRKRTLKKSSTKSSSTTTASRRRK